MRIPEIILDRSDVKNSGCGNYPRLFEDFKNITISMIYAAEKITYIGLNGEKISLKSRFGEVACITD